MHLSAIIFWGIIAYVIGSIPSSVWIGKSYFGKDVRDYGSGNAGATNTFRVLGTQVGIIVLLLDILKGVTAASLVLYMPSILHGTELYINLQLMFGILAVIGHIFPVFENFNGGKGIATLFGMLIGIHYILAIACVALFVVVLLLTRYVSLSSILATISFPFFAIYIFHRDEPLLIAFGVTAALMVVITHKKNIIRLLNGEETKANLFRNKS